MVTTENGVRMTDMELRHRVEEIIARKGWSTDRVAAEIPCSEDKLVDWLENSDDAIPVQPRRLRPALGGRPATR
jgi:hypothetical protein